MEKETCEMVSCGGAAKKLTIRHVRQPCQGMPVPVSLGRESPLDPFKRPTRQDMLVLGYIVIIVVINKIVINHLTKDDHGDKHKKKGD